jgi:hypothetical protein
MGRYGCTCGRGDAQLGPGDDAAMGVASETRKRLWARSGKRCVPCRRELVRADIDGLSGALVGEVGAAVLQHWPFVRASAVQQRACRAGPVAGKSVLGRNRSGRCAQVPLEA